MAGKEIKYELIDANNIQKDSFINITQNELKIIQYNWVNKLSHINMKKIFE